MVKSRSLRRRVSGMTLIEIMIVVTLIGLLAAMALPNFNRAVSNARRDQCITNLRMIATAKEHWSLETGAADTATPTSSNLDPYIRGGAAALKCPGDASATFPTSYSVNAINANPACEISPASHHL